MVIDRMNTRLGIACLDKAKQDNIAFHEPLHQKRYNVVQPNARMHSERGDQAGHVIRVNVVDNYARAITIGLD